MLQIERDHSSRFISSVKPLFTTFTLIRYPADCRRDISQPGSGREIFSYYDRVISETLRKVEEQAAEIGQLKTRVDTLEIQLKKERAKRQKFMTKSGLFSNTFFDI